MNEISYLNQVKYTGAGYLDAKIQPVETYEDLFKIPRAQRFVGLEIVVLKDANNGNKQTKYWLVDGTSNSDWVQKKSGTEIPEEVLNALYYKGDDSE